MNIKETVVKHISNMDSELLSMFLDDKETYQNADKEMYISKIEEIFNTFKANGDTTLIPHPGFCGSEECTNKGCKGYSFFGNVSNEYLSFIIEEKDGVIIGFLNCMFMISENDNCSHSNQLSVSIFTDEQLNFVPTIDYLKTVQNCKAALNDLKERYNNKLTKEDCLFWISKNEQLRNISSYYYLYGVYIDKFQDTFDEIKSTVSVAIKEKEANEAFVEFNSINITDENELLSWLVKYEEFGMELDLFFYYNNFADTKKIKDGFLPLKNNAEVSILVSDYKGICQFLTVFIKNYSNYKAYFVSSEDEEHWY